MSGGGAVALGVAGAGWRGPRVRGWGFACVPGSRGAAGGCVKKNSLEQFLREATWQRMSRRGLPGPARRL